jgi:hypothetical protein
MITKARWLLAIVLTTAVANTSNPPALAAGSGSSGGSSRSRSSGSTYRSQTQPMPSTRQSTLSSPGTYHPWNSGQFKNNNLQFKNNSGSFNNTNRINHAMVRKFSPNRFNPTWHNNVSPYWKKYGGWGHWWGPWYPWGIGFGWGWGSWYSPWCYWPYYQPMPVVEYVNPYTACSGTAIDGIDYSVPISQMPADSAVGGPNYFDAAQGSFQQGDYNSALGSIAKVCLQTPHNHDAHQFHSLVLFAMRDYCRSSIVAYAVLQDGPGWDWDTLQTLYPSPDVYTGQLRDLEHYASDNPSDANARVLLSYHYLMLNHTDSAGRQLMNVAKLQPNDKLSLRIRAGITDAARGNQPVVDANAQSVTTGRPIGTVPAGTNGSTQQPGPVPPAAPAPGTTPVPDATSTTSVPANPGNASPIAGTWKANPDKSVQIELALRDNGTFNWKFIANGRPTNFSGKYTLNGTTLALIRDTDGDAMEGTYSRKGDNSFQFRMKDADSEDPGLSFMR